VSGEDLKSDQKEDKEQEDERTKRASKLIDSFDVSHETNLADIAQFNRHQVMARATVFARNIANVRGNPADPDFMEQ